MVTTFYPPYNFGGDGIYVYRLTQALARRGHEVHVIYDPDAFALLSDHQPRPAAPTSANITHHPLTSRSAGPVDLFLSHQLGRPVARRAQLKTILDKSGFDVIHFHNVSLLGGPHVLTYGRAIKLCSMHDYWFVCPMHVLWRFDREACTRRTCLTCTLHGRRPPQWWRYNGNLAGAIRHVDAFIAPSHFSRDIHAAHGFPAPIHPIPHFLLDSEVSTWLEQPEEYRHPRPYFLFVGRLEKIKGVQLLLDIFRHYDKADLLIAGAGAYEVELRQLAHGLEHVHFLGLLDHGQLRGLYGRAIATLVPSLCYESFGWATLESFVTRTPVIVSHLGALPEVVQRGGGGLVYGTADELLAALEQLRTQPERRDQLGQQGYESYTKYYTEEQHIEMYYNLIAELQATRRSKEVA